MSIPAVLQFGHDQGESARLPLMISEARRASAVVIGTLVEAGPAPTAWSGLVASSQALTYDVTEVLKGSLKPGTLTVHQPVVAMSPMVRPDAPGLSARYLEVGQRYVVLVGAPDASGQLWTASDSVGIAVATEDLVGQMRGALR